MITPDYSDYLDERNMSLWEFVNNYYETKLEYTTEETYGVYTINKTSTIYVPFNVHSKSSFTHELLHIYIKVNIGSVGRYLENGFKHDKLLSKAYKYELINHLSNCLEHVKMLPKFIELGYPRNEFVVDYLERKSSFTSIIKILLDFKFVGHWTTSLELYLARYFAIKACPDSKRSYGLSLFMLKRINNPLYKILDNFWKLWLAFDINNLENNYHFFFYKFIDDLSAWAKNNSVQ